MAPQAQTDTEQDFITIIGPTMADVMASYHAQGLAGRHYAIVHRAGRHAFTMAGAGTATTLFDGAPMVAATFARHA